MDRIEHLLVDLRDEVIDCLGPLEERVVALADSVARVEEHASRPLPVLLPQPPATVDPGTAALVASAASALARVEARIEAEFAGLHRRIETLAARIDELDGSPHARGRLRVFRRSA